MKAKGIGRGIYGELWLKRPRLQLGYHIKKNNLFPEYPTLTEWEPIVQ
jgi:hypothetical protein